MGRWPRLAARLPSHAGALVLGGTLGWLIHRPTHDVSLTAPPSSPGDHVTLLAEAAVTASRDISPSDAPAAVTALPPRASVVHQVSAPERRAAEPSDDARLLDQAQAALNAGDAHAALAALSRRDGHFGGGPGASVRQRLLVRACALAAGRAEPACAGAAPAPP